MNTERLDYIDIAKGIGIILVIIGHIVWGDNYQFLGSEFLCKFIYSFHMPLFFIISGLCIKDSKRINQNTIKKMARSYLIPYAVWTVIYIILFQLKAVITGGSTVFSLSNGAFAHAITICGLAPLWFLLALFISEVIVIAFNPLLKNWGAGAWFQYC